MVYVGWCYTHVPFPSTGSGARQAGRQLLALRLQKPRPTLGSPTVPIHPTWLKSCITTLKIHLVSSFILPYLSIQVP